MSSEQDPVCSNEIVFVRFFNAFFNRHVEDAISFEWDVASFERDCVCLFVFPQTFSTYMWKMPFHLNETSQFRISFVFPSLFHTISI
jgi:hypothetical protein